MWDSKLKGLNLGEVGEFLTPIFDRTCTDVKSTAESTLREYFGDYIITFGDQSSYVSYIQ